MKSILAFTLLFFLSDHSARAQTIDDFLSETLLGMQAEFISENYRVNKSLLIETPPAYVTIDSMEFEGMEFQVNVFCRDGEVKAFGIWAEQLQIKDENGEFKHGNKVQLNDVFTKLHGQLIKLYGEAPRLRIESECCSNEPGALSQTYIWVNEEHALVCSFHDHLTSHSITLTQYKRNETNGEFTGEDDIAFYQKLYNEKSGKLPDVWPVKITEIKNETTETIIPNLKSEPPTKSHFQLYLLGVAVLAGIIAMIFVIKKRSEA